MMIKMTQSEHKKLVLVKNYFDSKYFQNWHDDTADIILTFE